MLIGQIAAIAQVSPRAIRHYHRAGILPEPARSPNGYRDYSVLDLTRLLRIRRLIGLGLPLQRIAETLRDEPEVLDGELEALEHDVRGSRNAAAVASSASCASRNTANTCRNTLVTSNGATDETHRREDPGRSGLAFASNV